MDGWFPQGLSHYENMNKYIQSNKHEIKIKFDLVPIYTVQSVEQYVLVPFYEILNMFVFPYFILERFRL